MCSNSLKQLSGFDRACLPAIYRLSIYLILSWSIISASQAFAGVPQFVHFQGRITKVDGQKSDSSMYRMKFALYSAPVGGSQLWTMDSSLTVPVYDGLFNCELGVPNPFPESLLMSDSLWLGVSLGNAPEISPRLRVTSDAFALRSSSSVQATFANAASVCDQVTVSASTLYSDTSRVAITAGHTVRTRVAQTLKGSGTLHRIAADASGSSLSTTDGTYQQLGPTLYVPPGSVDKYVVLVMGMNCSLSATGGGTSAAYQVRIGTMAGDSVLESGSLGQLHLSDIVFSLSMSHKYRIHTYYEPTEAEKANGFDIKIFASANSPQSSGRFAWVSVQYCEVVGQ